MWSGAEKSNPLSRWRGLLAGMLALLGSIALVSGLLLLFPLATQMPIDTPPSPTPRLAPTSPVTPTLAPTNVPTAKPTNTATPVPILTPLLPIVTPAVSEQVIGYSVRNQPITSIRLGYGERIIVLIGGINSGFAPSGITLARRFVTYFQDHQTDIPADVSLYIIVDGNPDSVYAPGRRDGRLNAKGVDLNRNWECDWQRVAQFEREPISGGDTPLSEPESRALHDFLLALRPDSVIIYTAFFTGGFVSPGYCNTFHSSSQDLGGRYGAGAGYAVGDYTTTEPGPGGGAYILNGDATNSLSGADIATISVLLPDHVSVDWEPNLRAVLVLLSGE